MNIVLNTFGTSILVENGVFLIEHKDGKQKITANKIKSISISRGAKISSDAALLAIDNEIDVLFVDKVGKPSGRLWSVKYGSISTIRRKQLDFIKSEEAVSWIKNVITKKINNQLALLFSIRDDNPEMEKFIESSVNKLDVYKEKINSVTSGLISDIAPTLRGWEGAASRIYWSVISESLPEKSRFERRSQHPATDIFNCLLNYGYGILYGKVEGALIKAGIDPYTGIFHRDDYNRPVLAYDVIELFRVWIDYVVISITAQDVIDEDCYSIKDGAYWLESMGKRILIQAVNDYFEEVIQQNGLQRSRATHIDLYAQNLAQIFLNQK